MKQTRSAPEQSPRTGSPLAARGDRPAARPTSTSGTEKRRSSKGATHAGPENARGQVVDLAAGSRPSNVYVQCWCGERHQVRERTVACSWCGRPTFDHHAVCPGTCRQREIERREAAR